MRVVLASVLAVLGMSAHLLAQGHGCCSHAAHGHSSKKHEAASSPTDASHKHNGHDQDGKTSSLDEGRQKTCPVMGNPIDKDVFIEYEGRKVYFCCKGCDKKFRDSPSEYLPALYEQIFPQSAQVRCPVMGGVVNPEVFVEHEGQRVHFCCKGCDAKFKADPNTYLKKLPEVSTDQVHCPVSGRAINPKHSIELGGKTVYFCSETCEPEFKAEFKKHMKVLRPETGLLARGPTAQEDLLLCPVCLPKGGIHKRFEVEMVEHSGFRYATCDDSCTKAFKADPGKYVDAFREELVRRAGGPGKAYTCQMHPNILTKSPGKWARQVSQPHCRFDVTKGARLGATTAETDAARRRDNERQE